MAVIRGTSSTAAHTASLAAVFPAGSAVGDQAIIFAGSTVAVSAPPGWTNLHNTLGGSNWAGQACTKTLTSGDIVAGSAAVTMSVAADSVAAMLVIKGANSGTVRETDAARNGSGSASIQITTSSTVQSTDLSIYFGSNETSSGGSTDTISRGTLYQQATTGNNASGCLYAELPAPAGATPVTFNYATPGNGNYQVVVVVEVTRIPVAAGIVVEPQIDCPTGVKGQFVRFRLRGFAGFVPQTTGSGYLADVTATLDSGSIDQNLIPNASITPAGTFYTAEIWSNGRIVSSGNMVLTGDVDLSTLL